MSLTRFQKARILASRALQISQGAPSVEVLADSMDPLKVAMQEMDRGHLPLVPRRAEDDGN